jgi:4-amino-4-deoxy-L-arabinose transferase-like glycosyltransferase
MVDISGDKPKIKFMTDFIQRYKKIITVGLVVVLLGAMFLTLISLAKGDSGTTDEVAHIPAGFSYVNQLDYRLNPEHPPLAKVLAGIPLQFLHLNTWFDSWQWKTADQWDSGWHFIYQIGNNADRILFWARFPIILLTITLGILIFLWVKSMYGRKVALFILTLYTFSPEFLANGHLVTTDVAAALGFVIGIWSYVRFLQKKTWGSLVAAGVLFGIAQTLKFSCFLLVPVLFLLFIGFIIIFREQGQKFWKLFWPQFWKFLLVLLIGFVTVWIIYLPLTWKTPPSVEHAVIENNLTQDPRTLWMRNGLHHFENNKLTRPAEHYVLGLLLNFGRIGGGNSTYIMGHFADKAIRWYFPAAWMVKIPLVDDALVAIGLYLLICYGFQNQEDKWRLYYVAVPLFLYWAITLSGSLDIGIRHLLPTVPLMYLFIARSIDPIFNSHLPKIKPTQKLVLQILTLFLIVWYVVTSILTYPFYLSYFNELTWGQPKYKYLVDSNLDWGQDMKRLANYVNANPQIDKIKIDYFGGSVPNYYINQNKIIDWHSDQGPATGWFAISAEYFQMSKLVGVEQGKWDYSWLEQFKPVTIIGNSILVFDITPQDLINHPPKPLAAKILITPQEAAAQRSPQTAPAVAN